MVDMERVIVLLLDCRFLVSVIRCNAEIAFVYILIGYSNVFNWQLFYPR